jgi:hypothetical protein
MGLTERVLSQSSCPRSRHGAAAASDGRPAARALIISPEIMHLQRRLGPLAWTVVQHMALACHRTEDGWAAAVGVRDIAFSIGVTEDTAARAVSTPRAAGLVTRELIECNEKPRSGYQLRLPAEIRLIDCPDPMDRTDHGAFASLSPSGDYSTRARFEPERPNEDDSPGRTRVTERTGVSSSCEELSHNRHCSMRSSSVMWTRNQG